MMSASEMNKLLADLGSEYKVTPGSSVNDGFAALLAAIPAYVDRKLAAAPPKMFKVNSQQWFAIDSIEAVNDYGFEIGVTLKSGVKHRIANGDRDTFLALIERMTA